MAQATSNPSESIAVDMTLWTVARALCLVAIILAGLWFVIASRSAEGFASLLLWDAFFVILYGILTGLEWLAVRM